MGKETISLKREEKNVSHETRLTNEQMRFELAKSAIGGVALHEITKINLVAMRAVALADAVIFELERDKV